MQSQLPVTCWCYLVNYQWMTEVEDEKLWLVVRDKKVQQTLHLGPMVAIFQVHETVEGFSYQALYLSTEIARHHLVRVVKELHVQETNA